MAKRRHSQKFMLRFVGPGMSPTAVRCGEVAEILVALEEIVSGILGRPREELGLSLVEVRNTSAAYAISSSAKATTEALAAWYEAAQRGDYSRIPAPAIDSSRKVLAFIRRHGCIGQLTKPNRLRPIAELTPDTEIQTAGLSPLSGRAVVYGEVVRVGGATLPRAVLRTTDDDLVYVDIGDRELARQVGQRLYTWIGLAGEARWHPNTQARLSFCAEQLLPFDNPPATDSLTDLSKLVGQDFDGIEDVEAYSHRLRSLADL